MQLAPQTVDKLQNAAGFRFDNRLYYQLATAVEDSDHHRFLVHVHPDILDVATHAVASLRERSFALNGVFPSRYSVILQPICPSSPLLLTLLPRFTPLIQGRSLIMHWPFVLRPRSRLAKETTQNGHSSTTSGSP